MSEDIQGLMERMYGHMYVLHLIVACLIIMDLRKVPMN